jgi:hypothetical protein
MYHHELVIQRPSGTERFIISGCAENPALLAMQEVRKGYCTDAELFIVNGHVKDLWLGLEELAVLPIQHNSHVLVERAYNEIPF